MGVGFPQFLGPFLNFYFQRSIQFTNFLLSLFPFANILFDCKIVNHFAIIIQDGGVRNLVSKKSFTVKKYGEGIYRNSLQISLNGIEVFNFSLREVVPNIKTTLKHFNRQLDEFDHLVFHQANRLINETIRKMLKVDPSKVPYSLHDFGNTSCSSIPLTIVSQIREQLEEKPKKLLLSAFGIGLSWGTVLLETDGIIVPEFTEQAAVSIQSKE